MRLEYNFSGTANNGNIASQSMSANGSIDRIQTFAYDGVNRLASASESSGYSQTYAYDRWSNRWLNSSSGLAYADPNEPTSSAQFNQSNNRLTGATYDAAGNQLTYNGYTFEYDADGQNTVVRVTSSNVVYITNAYDGEGRRVKKTESGATTYYVYDAFGRLAAEYTPDTPVPGTSYAFTDMLGSVRAVTSSAGALQECYDYLPFGRMLSSSDNGRGTAGCYPSSANTTSVTSRMSQKFTGQPHDNGTGLDYFGARFYSAPMGRFTSPDPVLITSRRMRQPHTLNLYAYANNNPLRYTDPSGLDSMQPIYNPFADASNPWTPEDTVASYISFLVNINGWSSEDAYGFLYSLPGGMVNIALLDYQRYMASMLEATAQYVNEHNAKAQEPQGTVTAETVWMRPKDPVDTPVHGLWTYGNWCGEGGCGTPINATDMACMFHDRCFERIPLTAAQYRDANNLTPEQIQAAQSCNQQFCNTVSNITIGLMLNPNAARSNSQQIRSGMDILLYFRNFGPKGGRCR